MEKQAALNLPPDEGTRLHGKRLIGARIGWLTFFILAIVALLVAIPLRWTELTQPTPITLANLKALGWPVSLYALYSLSTEWIFIGAYLIVALIIFIRRSDDWMAIFTSLMLVAFGVGNQTIAPTIGALRQYPVGPFIFAFFGFAAWVTFSQFWYIFPGGRYAPRWTRITGALWLVVTIPWNFMVGSSLDPTTWPPVIFLPLMLVLWGSFPISQIYRYKRVSTPIQRQQTKWVVYALGLLAIWIVTELALISFYGEQAYTFLAGAEPPTPQALSFLLVLLGLIRLAFLALPLAFFLSILRYRLWDIDLIIRKTIQYGALTALGFAVYLILAGGASLFLQTQSNLIPLLIAVGLALAVARPALRRMNILFDRFMPLPERPIAMKQKPIPASQTDEAKLNKPAVIWMLGGLPVALAVANLVVFATNWGTPVPATWGIQAGPYNTLSTLLYKLVVASLLILAPSLSGLLIIIRRPRQPIGRLLYLAGVAFGLVELFSELTIYTNFTAPGVPGYQLIALINNWLWITPFALSFWAMAIFPSGRLPSRRWRWLLGAIVLWTVGMTLTGLIEQTMLSAFGLPNPLPVAGFENVRAILFAFSIVLMPVIAISTAALLIHRFRRTQGEERQQIKWLAGAVFLTALTIFAGFVLRFILNIFAGEILFNISLVFIPLGIGVAILRFRLYDIDIIIRRTLIYGGLVGGLGLAYFSSVALVQFMSQALTGPQSNLIVVAITLTIAALFNPARRKFQTLIDRRFYREKVDAREALIAFGREVRTIIELPALLQALVTRTTELLHIEHGAVFLVDEQGAFQLAEARNLPEETASFHAALHETFHPSPKESAPAMEIASDLPLDNEDLARLQNGQPISRAKDKSFPLLVPLIAPISNTQYPKGTTSANLQSLIAILALGPRRSDQGYSREDQTLLTGLADQAGTAIYVAQLIEDRQAEAIKREESERQLESYRNSPAGQAETIAQTLISNLPISLAEIHTLTQKAGSDPEAAAVLESLSPAFIAADAPLLAALSDGYRYLFSAQNAPEMLVVGLRELSNGLASSEAEAINGANDALLLYSLAQKALSANSIPQITELLPPLQEMGRWGREAVSLPDREIGRQGHKAISSPDKELLSSLSAHPPTRLPAYLTPLSQALSALTPTADALHAHERVDAPQDKLAYLASAVERLGHVERLARSELGAADRPLILQIVENWRNVVTGAMSDLQTQARISCRLLTRHTWTGEIISLALAVRNTGRGAALNVKVSLSPGPEYTLLEESAIIDHLPAGEERQVELVVRPRLTQGVSQFRARFIILYDDPRGPDQLENFADVVYLMADEGEFQFIPNPYVVGTPLQGGSNLFFGREDIISFIQENLVAAHQNNLVLIGQRRTGKTSLLKQLQTRLDDTYLSVYLDGQSLALDPGLPNFFFGLATEITFALEDANLEIERFFELSDFSDSPAVTFERKFLTAVRQAIGQRHLLLLLDEFEELETAVRRGNIDPSVFGFLRHLIQHSDNLSVIFCGTHRLEELAADYWSVLFNISLYRHVAYLSHDEAMHLIQKPVAGFNMRYDDLALEKMWRVTAGHPYFLQLLCHSLVNQHNKSQRNYVTVADVNTALDEILASGEAHFVFMWTESSHEERLVLTALSRMMPLTGRTTPIQVLDYLAERGINLARQSVSEAMHRLALRDTLRLSSQDSNGNAPNLAEADSYSWQLGLLGLWVEKYKSLSRVVDEK